MGVEKQENILDFFWFWKGPLLGPPGPIPLGRAPRATGALSFFYSIWHELPYLRPLLGILVIFEAPVISARRVCVTRKLTLLIKFCSNDVTPLPPQTPYFTEQKTQPEGSISAVS